MKPLASALIFDTHAFVKRLIQVGMPVEQAEVLSEEQARLIDNRLATKDDLKRLEERIDTKLDKLESRINQKLISMESEINQKFSSMESRIDRLMLQMTIRLGSMVAGVAGVIITVIKFL